MVRNARNSKYQQQEPLPERGPGKNSQLFTISSISCPLHMAHIWLPLFKFAKGICPPPGAIEIRVSWQLGIIKQLGD